MATTTIGSYSINQYPTSVKITTDGTVVTFRPDDDPSKAFSIPMDVAQLMTQDLVDAILPSL